MSESQPIDKQRIARQNILGVLLAGGLARRMGGGDKCLRTVGGKTMLTHAINRAGPQVGSLIINAAGDPERFASYGFPVVPDAIEGFAGPLAGILTAMEWAHTHAPEVAWVASFATDAPFFPEDLTSRLAQAIECDGAEMACAQTGARTHPVFALWPVALAAALRRAMEDEKMRKIDLWTARYKIAHVVWTSDPVDPFFNINTVDDLHVAEEFSL
ncbi:molybdenum cofactor guanylyltransferase MobA [Varunaivibrio sulfuroxidans]|uniref:Molybdenum cofactor guanylyltransferase n=1 Tax=Varunaivibrio sulfuroxidans TaxID=1773489 RepID=A0A4R3JFJ8_9PROT|nr:molybdenum cofactor guanylyltransferase MobA [Varunaivibrio sulfuroxidans]TCS63460.1 molybdenum cofactor guanylyltransferase [Varunaivibrio sulfuroxidans]WES30394.1 molybdenum cofactor guanylyltransferase MobA [Varunaivibrio sulfuroxidans]